MEMITNQVSRDLTFQLTMSVPGRNQHFNHCNTHLLNPYYVSDTVKGTTTYSAMASQDWHLLLPPPRGLSASNVT